MKILMIEPDEQDTPYVSIQADVHLDWRLLNEHESAQASATFTQRSATIGLCSEIEYHKEMLSPSIQKVSRDHPDIASWLGFLQQTVEILASQLNETRNIQLSTEPGRVSISASGIEFTTSQECAVGGKIEMVMVLQPSVASMMVMGEITHVTPKPSPPENDNTEYQLKVHFNHIRDSDQEILIRHIHRVQLDELRTARAIRDERSANAD